MLGGDNDNTDELRPTAGKDAVICSDIYQISDILILISDIWQSAAAASRLLPVSRLLGSGWFRMGGGWVSRSCGVLDPIYGIPLLGSLLLLLLV